MKKRKAYWTYSWACGSYYFAPRTRRKSPYFHQKRVAAILDIARDGTLAGIEIIDSNLPPPPLKEKKK